jgi:lipoprotein NlpI
MHMYARSMFSLGKWQEAAKAWEEYRRQDDDPYFYGRLTESLSIEQYKGLKAGREHFLNLVGHLQLSPWEQSLKVYHLGEISDSQLLGKAKNACERTEAYYYIGFQFWVAGRKEKAREYMKSAIDENIYGFNEYISARYHLHQL